MTDLTNETPTDVLEAIDKHRNALLERLGTFADLCSTNPLPGDAGDVAYDLLRKAFAQIASDRLRLASLASRVTLAESPSEATNRMANTLGVGLRRHGRWNEAPREPLTEDMVERIAEIVHGATVWAAKLKGGEPRAWQGGNSTAEDQARRTARKIVALSSQHGQEKPSAEDPLADPIDWESGGRVHNWKNYVSGELRELWFSMTDQVKLAIAENAQNIADNEEWE